MAKTYTTKTASLKATTADVRKVNAQEIKVWTGNAADKTERVNILDLIKSGNVIYDDRGGNITENDIWPNPITLDNTSIVTDTKGNISINYSADTYNTFDYSEMTDTQKAKIKTAAKVIDNKVLDANGAIRMNWETAAFTNTNGDMNSIFGGTFSKKARSVTEWDSDLSSLTYGTRMFYNTYLESFTGDLSNLTNGFYMFWSCSNLTSFDSDLPSLTNGNFMFYQSALTSFSGDLSSLENGSAMFQGAALKSFSSDLPSLTNGERMFSYCIALESFNSDLSSLTNGRYMFSLCKLNAESVQIILHFINPDEKTGTSQGAITIGTNIINDSTVEAQKLEFAKTCLCDSWSELDDEFTAKGWTVTWQFNGEAASSASTLELTDSNISTALWAKLEEVTEENAPYGYVSEEDGKHYNISWFHETNGSTEGYEHFGSLLEACGAFGVIPKEYAESNN